MLGLELNHVNGASYVMEINIQDKLALILVRGRI